MFLAELYAALAQQGGHVLAQRLFYKYLARGSAFELNITDQQRCALARRLKYMTLVDLNAVREHIEELVVRLKKFSS
jgi:hypothetical protein